MTSSGPGSQYNRRARSHQQQPPHQQHQASSRTPVYDAQRLNRLFGEKMVMELGCAYCCSPLCNRGMKALLLADTATELYSTDLAPYNSTALVGADYQTTCCECRISDVACLTCGNTVGYHVTQPCRSCLKACNNGHLWMFLGTAVRPQERLDGTGCSLLNWANIPRHERAIAKHAEDVALPHCGDADPSMDGVVCLR